MGLSWTWILWSPSGLTWNQMTMIYIWASPGPGDSGPYLGIIGFWYWLLVFYTSASPGPGDSGHPLDLTLTW